MPPFNYIDWGQRQFQPLNVSAAAFLAYSTSLLWQV
jgi:hypothetical protein